MATLVLAVAQPQLAPFRMSDRFRHEVTFFMTPGDAAGAPQLARGEYWIRLEDARTALDDGVVRIVSPLDSANRAEIEITEEHELWLEWMIAHAVEHVRLKDEG